MFINFSTHEAKGIASTFSLNFREFYETLIISIFFSCFCTSMYSRRLSQVSPSVHLRTSLHARMLFAFVPVKLSNRAVAFPYITFTERL